MKGLLVSVLLLLSGGVRGQASVVEYIHTDALGSIVAVTNAQGQVIERREYAPYGHQLTPAVQNGPGYTGHVQDAATGLVYMQQRYYDPAIGRFLSVDPVGPLSNPINHFGRYHYANNNPYKYTDPDGRQAADRFSDAFAKNPQEFSGPEHTIPAVVVTAVMASPAIPLLLAAPDPSDAALAAAGARAISGARGAAETARASGASGGATSAVVTSSGRVFTGASTNAGGPGGATNSVVQGALDAVPAASRAPFHGCCGEINALSNAANAGQNLNGAIVATVRAVGAGADKVMKACPSCRAVAEKLGVRVVEPAAKR